MSSVQQPARFQSDVREMLIRDLVERYPEVMPILHHYGMDLCCGGAHTIPDAASLHGLDAEQLTAEAVAAIEAIQG